MAEEQKNKEWTEGIPLTSKLELGQLSLTSNSHDIQELANLAIALLNHKTIKAYLKNERKGEMLRGYIQ